MGVQRKHAGLAEGAGRGRTARPWAQEGWDYSFLFVPACTVPGTQEVFNWYLKGQKDRPNPPRPRRAPPLMSSCFSHRLLGGTAPSSRRTSPAPASTPSRRNHGASQTPEPPRRCLVTRPRRRQGGAGGDLGGRPCPGCGRARSPSSRAPPRLGGDQGRGPVRVPRRGRRPGGRAEPPCDRGAAPSWLPSGDTLVPPVHAPRPGPLAGQA